MVFFEDFILFIFSHLSVCLEHQTSSSQTPSHWEAKTDSVLLGVKINKIATWVPEEAGLLMHKEFPGVVLCSLYVLTLSHTDNVMFSGSRLQQQK